MSHQLNLWIQAYQAVKAQWNITPDWKLIEYRQLIPQGPVLDLGMGNGRNALFFAKMGNEVDCVDISRTYVKKCKERAKAENLDLTAQVADLRSFEIPKRRYALIIASKILQLFRKAEIDAIAYKIHLGLARRGVVYVRTFSLEYVKRLKDTQNLELVEPNTYYSPRYQLHFHYFTKEEVQSIFPKLKILSCIEGVELDLSYKKPKPRWIIEYLGQRVR